MIIEFGVNYKGVKCYGYEQKKELEKVWNQLDSASYDLYHALESLREMPNVKEKIERTFDFCRIDICAIDILKEKIEYLMK